MNKEELLTNLYALRAGMSYLSVKKDEAEELQACLADLEEEKQKKIEREHRREGVKSEDYLASKKKLETVMTEYYNWLKVTTWSIVWRSILIVLLIPVVIAVVQAIVLFIKAISLDALPLELYVQYFSPENW